MRLDTQVLALDRTTLATPAGAIRARAVLIAADPPAAARLLGIPSPTMRALTTYYHRTNQAPTNCRLLHLDGDRDGGPVINTAVASNVAPRYAPPGIALIASTVLGVTDDALEAPVRGHAARIYGVDPQHWEHVATYPISAALPAMPAGQALRQPVDLGDGIFVAGDHRDTPSIQGALSPPDTAPGKQSAATYTAPAEVDLEHRSHPPQPAAYRQDVPATLTQLTGEGLQFLHERHLATFSSRHADGTPHVTPIGFTWDADRHISWVITSGRSRKARNATRGDPVAICQLDGRRWITLIGTPRVSTDPDEIVAAVARYTDRYRPPRPNPTRVAIAVSITGLLGSPTLVAHQAHA